MTGLILGREMERSLFNQDCSFLTGSSAVSQRQSGARRNAGAGVQRPQISHLLLDLRPFTSPDLHVLVCKVREQD